MPHMYHECAMQVAGRSPLLTWDLATPCSNNIATFTCVTRPVTKKSVESLRFPDASEAVLCP